MSVFIARDVVLVGAYFLGAVHHLVQELAHSGAYRGASQAQPYCCVHFIGACVVEDHFFGKLEVSHGQFSGYVGFTFCYPSVGSCLGEGS